MSAVFMCSEVHHMENKINDPFVYVKNHTKGPVCVCTQECAKERERGGRIYM